MDRHISLPKELNDTPQLYKDKLREELLRNNQLYLEEKIEVGEKISSIMDEGIVREESLTKERKLALDLYRKYRKHQPLEVTIKLDNEHLTPDPMTVSVHTIQPQPTCTICGRVFTRNVNCFQHQRRCGKPKPSTATPNHLACLKSKNTYSARRHLKVHMLFCDDSNQCQKCKNCTLHERYCQGPM